MRRVGSTNREGSLGPPSRIHLEGPRSSRGPELRRIPGGWTTSEIHSLADKMVTVCSAVTLPFEALPAVLTLSGSRPSRYRASSAPHAPAGFGA